MSKKSFTLPALLAMSSLLGSTYASENNKPEQVKINQFVSNNTKTIPPSNSLNISNVIAFTLGAGAGVAGGYLGTKKFVVDSVDEENQKLKNENNTLKNKKDYKDDYDKKCKECDKLVVEYNNLLTENNKLSAENNQLKNNLGEDNPVDLKNKINKLQEKLKVFTDVWGDPDDNGKMTKMKNLYNWRYGHEGDGTYDYYIKDCKKNIKNIFPNDIDEQILKWAIDAACNAKNVNVFKNWAFDNAKNYEKNFPGYYNALQELCDRQEALTDTLKGT